MGAVTTTKKTRKTSNKGTEANDLEFGLQSDRMADTSQLIIC